MSIKRSRNIQRGCEGCGTWIDELEIQEGNLYFSANPRNEDFAAFGITEIVNLLDSDISIKDEEYLSANDDETKSDK